MKLYQQESTQIRFNNRKPYTQILTIEEKTTWKKQSFHSIGFSAFIIRVSSTEKLQDYDIDKADRF